LFVFEVLLNNRFVFAGISVAAVIIFLQATYAMYELHAGTVLQPDGYFPLYTAAGCPKYARFLTQGHIIYEKFAIKPLAIIKLNC